jgi:hypothetical protein
MNTLTDRPHFRFGGQCRERLDGIIGDDIVELSHESLIGTENNRANRTHIGLSFAICHRSNRFTFSKARTQSQFHRAIIVAQCAHRFFILPDA